MIEIGKKNKLKIEKFTDHGAYLTDGTDRVLLPRRYLWGTMRLGEEIDVFVYTDSEDRPVATTDLPVAEVGELAYLEVVGTNRFGAFLDWGLPKDLLVPFSEQKAKMRTGGRYPVYVYLDDASKRVVASAKIGKFIGNAYPDMKRGDEVDAFVYEKSEYGWKVAVNNLYQGMIYDNEIFVPVRVGDKFGATVKNVRDDGKIDLLLGEKSVKRVADLASRILADYKANGNVLTVNDSSTPEDIKSEYQCSKKDFKKALGQLLKERMIDLDSVRKG
ncbi:MAG: GntR family transcriptional regulator [Paramuribaculum sp.]|nr:GntR family transcriptional regulator [Paramuribaculum sp.]